MIRDRPRSSFKLSDRSRIRPGRWGAQVYKDMVLILLSVVLAAIVVAISIIRYHISFGNFTGSGIAREDIAISGERAKQSRIARPVKPYLVVVLPDGKLLSSWVVERFH
jgi:hypothetical protein